MIFYCEKLNELIVFTAPTEWIGNCLLSHLYLYDWVFVGWL